MKKPIKPGSEASETKKGGALSDIHKPTGDPVKGSAGPAPKDKDSSAAKSKGPVREPKD